MRRFAILAVLIVLPLAAAMAQEAAAPAWNPVTVVTTDGWNLPGCSLSWIEDGRRVRVTRPDGTWKDFDPWTVKQVLAADGADLTAEVAAARPGDPSEHAHALAPTGDYSEVGVAVTEPIPVENSLAQAPAARPPFKAMIGAGAGYGAYSGDWFIGFQDDLSWHGKVRLNYGGKEWVTFGYQRQKGGSEEGTIYVDDMIGWVDVSAEVHIDEFQLLAGTTLGRAVPGTACGYFEAGLVIMRHVVSGSVSGYGSDSYSETKLGAQLQLGGIIPLAQTMALDIGGSVVAKSSLFDDEEAGGLIFGAHVGLAYLVR